MSIDLQPRSSVAAATAAVQSFPGFSETLGRILAQRKDQRSYIPYYVFNDEVQNINLGGINISIKFDPPGADYYPTIAESFSDITLATGLSFKEVASKSDSLFDIGRLEDGYSRFEYYGPDGAYVLGQSLALGNEFGQLWRLKTWGESLIDNPSSKVLDTQATIRHEIGHSVGLSHHDPEGGGVDGDNSAFNQLDTVMSYNVTDPPNALYTDADINALKNMLASVQADLEISPGISIQKDNTKVFEFDDVTQKFVTSAPQSNSRFGPRRPWNRFAPRRPWTRLNSLNARPASHERAWGDGRSVPAVDVWSPPHDPITGLKKRFAYGDANSGHDLRGTTQDDAIAAGHGDDWVSTGLGDDVIDAGPGVNRIRTGPGHDVVVIRFREDGSGYDAIHDFSDQDRVRLIGFSPEGLSLTTYGQQSILNYFENIVGVFNHPLTFSRHVEVVV